MTTTTQCIRGLLQPGSNTAQNTQLCTDACNSWVREYQDDAVSELITGKNSAYYVRHDLDGELDNGTFNRSKKSQWYVVHKRFWHLHHNNDDSCRPSRLHLPPKCYEDMESHIVVSLPRDEALLLLQKFGFTLLQPATDTEHEVEFVVANKPYRVQMVAETPEIITQYKKAVGRGRTKTPFAHGVDVEEFHRQWARRHKLYVERTDFFNTGAYYAAMSVKLWNSLPQFDTEEEE